MYLRLAFAVAAHLEPEILVVDEVLAVGDAEFQRKCLGKMDDVANEGRTVLFVSHNMSAILRLTRETVVLDKGEMVMQAPSVEAVDYYLSHGFSQGGERIWLDTESACASAPFCPLAMRVINQSGNISDTVRSAEDFSIEFEYRLDEPVTGLRVGIYLISTRGEFVFTSFDVDDPEMYEKYAVRQRGLHVSRCRIPADLLNEGRFVIGVNASAFRIKRYFHDEQVLTLTWTAPGRPGHNGRNRGLV